MFKPKTPCFHMGSLVVALRYIMRCFSALCTDCALTFLSILCGVAETNTFFSNVLSRLFILFLIFLSCIFILVMLTATNEENTC